MVGAASGRPGSSPRFARRSSRRTHRRPSSGERSISYGPPSTDTGAPRRKENAELGLPAPPAAWSVPSVESVDAAFQREKRASKPPWLAPARDDKQASVGRATSYAS